MAAASESLVFTSSQYTEPTQEVVYSSNNEESSDSEETDANGLTDHDDGHDYENDSVETLSGDDSDSSSDEAGEEEQEQEGRCGLAANGGDYAMAEGAQSGQGPSSEAGRWRASPTATSAPGPRRAGVRTNVRAAEC